MWTEGASSHCSNQLIDLNASFLWKSTISVQHQLCFFGVPQSTLSRLEIAIRFRKQRFYVRQCNALNVRRHRPHCDENQGSGSLQNSMQNVFVSSSILCICNVSGPETVLWPYDVSSIDIGHHMFVLSLSIVLFEKHFLLHCNTVSFYANDFSSVFAHYFCLLPLKEEAFPPFTPAYVYILSETPAARFPPSIGSGQQDGVRRLFKRGLWNL